MMSLIKIMIVEDHSVTLKGTKLFLSHSPELEVIGEATTAKNLISLLEIEEPDIILVDISLPDMDGIQLTKKIKSNHPKIKIIIFSASSEKETVIDSFKVGANGYLSKKNSMEEMIFAIKKVFSGDVHISSSIAENIAKDIIFQHAGIPKKDNGNILDNLSNREMEVFKMLAEGKTYQEISSILFISYRTVETHKSNIFKKTKINSIAELVKLAIRQKIISVDE